MKKVTKKMVGDFLADTKGVTQWSVISFDKKTGVRKDGYGGFDFMHAFAAMTTSLHKGFDVILTDKDGWEYHTRFEIDNNRRITYNELKPYEIYIDSFDFTIVNPKKQGYDIARLA